MNFVDDVWNEHKDTKFIVWLGDSPGHDLYAQTKESHEKVLTILTNKFLEHYNQIGSLYPILGNHEGLPCDDIDVHGESPNWLYEFSANLWRPWLTPDCIFLV